MPVIRMNTLFLGSPSPQIFAILTRLGRKGWGSYSADSVTEGRGLVESCEFEVILSQEQLPDGRGYDLIEPVVARGGSLIVSVELRTKSLWLPVVDHGENILGACAIHPDVLEPEIEKILAHKSPAARPRCTWVPPVPPHVAGSVSHPIPISFDSVVEQPRTESRTERVSLAALRSLRTAVLAGELVGKGRDVGSRHARRARQPSI